MYTDDAADRELASVADARERESLRCRREPRTRGQLDAMLLLGACGVVNKGVRVNEKVDFGGKWVCR